MSTADPVRLLAVDIGNHQIKLGLFASDSGGLPQPAQTWKVPTREGTFDRLAELLPLESLTWHAATVHRQAERQLAAWVQARRPGDSYRLLRNDDLPLAIHVEQPQRVGTDRLLAAVAVNRLRAPNRPAIVVDAGTAITVDVVSAAGAFEGGVILPGFRLTARALSEGTDLLPEVDYDPAAGPPPGGGQVHDCGHPQRLVLGTSRGRVRVGSPHVGPVGCSPASIRRRGRRRATRRVSAAIASRPGTGPGRNCAVRRAKLLQGTSLTIGTETVFQQTDRGDWGTDRGPNKPKRRGRDAWAARRQPPVPNAADGSSCSGMMHVNQVADFGVLQPGISTLPTSSSRSPMFFQMCQATGGSLLFDLDLYRELSPAARRLFLKLKDRFWRTKRVFMNVDDLTINGLGFSADRPLKKRKYDLTGCIRELLDHRIIELGRGQTEPKDLFMKRAKGLYVVQFFEGEYFRQPAGRTHRCTLQKITDDPLYQPLQDDRCR